MSSIDSPPCDIQLPNLQGADIQTCSDSCSSLHTHVETVAERVRLPPVVIPDVFGRPFTATSSSRRRAKTAGVRRPANIASSVATLDTSTASEVQFAHLEMSYRSESYLPFSQNLSDIIARCHYEKQKKKARGSHPYRSIWNVRLEPLDHLWLKNDQLSGKEKNDKVDENRAELENMPLHATYRHNRSKSAPLFYSKANGAGGEDEYSIRNPMLLGVALILRQTQPSSQQASASKGHIDKDGNGESQVNPVDTSPPNGVENSTGVSKDHNTFLNVVHKGNELVSQVKEYEDRVTEVKEVDDKNKYLKPNGDDLDLLKKVRNNPENPGEIEDVVNQEVEDANLNNTSKSLTSKSGGTRTTVSHISELDHSGLNENISILYRLENKRPNSLMSEDKPNGEDIKSEKTIRAEALVSQKAKESDSASPKSIPCDECTNEKAGQSEDDILMKVEGSEGSNEIKLKTLSSERVRDKNRSSQFIPTNNSGMLVESSNAKLGRKAMKNQSKNIKAKDLAKVNDVDEEKNVMQNAVDGIDQNSGTGPSKETKKLTDTLKLLNFTTHFKSSESFEELMSFMQTVLEDSTTLAQASCFFLLLDINGSPKQRNVASFVNVLSSENCKNLSGKPKFIFASVIEGDGIKVPAQDGLLKSGEPDVLLCLQTASTPSTVNTRTASLSKALEKYGTKKSRKGKRIELQRILTHAHKASNGKSNSESQQCIYSTLSKKFFTSQ